MLLIPKEPCCVALLRHGGRWDCLYRSKMVTINYLKQAETTKS